MDPVNSVSLLKSLSRSCGKIVEEFVEEYVSHVWGVLLLSFRRCSPVL